MPFKLFELQYISLGLRSAGQNFKRFLLETLRELEFHSIYIDDILSATEDDAEHLLHQRTVGEQLQKFDFDVGSAKCKLGSSSVDQNTTENVIRPISDKLQPST